MNHGGPSQSQSQAETGPSADGQVLAAVDDLVGDDRKAKAVRRRSPGAEVSSLECSRSPEGQQSSGGVAEADGIAAPAIEVLEVETDIALAEKIAPDPEADRRRETRAFRQEVLDDLGVGLTAHPLQVGNVVAVARGEAPDRALRRMSSCRA